MWKQLAIVFVAAAAAMVIIDVVVRAVGSDNRMLDFVVGTMIGAWAGGLWRHRAGDRELRAATLLVTGAASAVAAVAVTFAFDAWVPLRYPEITLPFAVVGAFVWPFVMRGSMVKAFAAPPSRK